MSEQSSTGWRRTPGQGKYARPENERRFLLARPPETLGEPHRIEDRYLDGTRLRLRSVQVGDEVVHKLTQKVRLDEQDPFAVALTNIYLSAEEHHRLAGLPGATLHKTRHLVEVGASTFAVDRFEGSLDGLWLAEAEVATRDDALDLPDWIGTEVTGDDRYAGASLARIADLTELPAP